MDFWTYGWLGIGALALCWEVAAWVFGGKGATLSEHHWHRWFPAWWQRSLLILTITSMLAHLALGFIVHPFAVLFLGWYAPTIAWVEWKARRARKAIRGLLIEVEGGGAVGLISRAKDKLVKVLMLRWLKGKADQGRKEGSPLLKLTDGWKNRLVNGAYFGAFLAHQATGNSYVDFVRSVTGAMGYAEPNPGLLAQLSVAATIVWSLWGNVDSIIKFVKQIKAGAKATEIFSTEGAVKQALSEGTIPTIVAEVTAETLDKVALAQAAVVAAGQAQPVQGDQVQP